MRKILIFALLVLTVLGLQVACGFALFYFIPDLDNRAKFGEMFIVVHALFDGLALAALIFTVISQDKEIKEQGVRQSELVKVSALSALLNAEYALLYSKIREFERSSGQPRDDRSAKELEISRREEEIHKLTSTLNSMIDIKMIEPSKQEEKK